MADITRLSRLVAGVMRGVDISANTLVTFSIKVGGGISNTELTKAILDRLVSLQNGSDVDATYHTHDTRYYTETELSATSVTPGAGLIGIHNLFANFTPTSSNVQGALEGIDTALGAASSTDFSDAVFRISDDGTPSKKIAFQASGISAATTRTITMPDANVDLTDVNNAILKNGSRTFTANQPMGGFKLTGLSAGTVAGDSVRYEQAILTSGANAFAADQSFGGFKATNLADPTANQDAVTLSYMNARLAGIKPKSAVRVASVADVSIATGLENGDTVDGVTLATGDRVLLKDQTLPETNGIYIVSASGAASRSTDFDSLTPVDEINGAWMSVQEGTANAGKIFVQFGTVAVLGTDPINFEYFNAIAGLIGGDMITFAGSTFSVDLAATSGLESTNPGNPGGQLRIKLESSNPTLFITGSNELAVKLDAAGAVITGAAGLKSNVDNSTIEINTNALRVKPAGITGTHLAASVAGAGLAGGAGSPLSVNTADGVQIVGDNVTAKVSDIAGSGLEDDGSNNLRIAASAAGAGLAGGAGAALSVLYAPKGQIPAVAGESFAGNVSWLVRWALDGETAGRVYKADIDASSLDAFYAFGIVLSGTALSAADPCVVVTLGSHTLGSGDTPFASTDVGKAVYLDAAGAFTLVAPTTVDMAVWRVGMVQDVNKIWVDAKQLNGIN